MSAPGVSEPGGSEPSRVVLRGLLTNILLACGQITVGIFGRSAALVADGFHTLSDLLSDSLVWLASRFGARAADQDHPYGHARIETAGAFGLSLVLIGTGIGIALHAADILGHPGQLAPPDLAALAMAMVAIGVKEGLYWYTQRAAQRLRSQLLRANAWHYRTDVFSSAVVAVGVAGSLLGVHDLDAIAAIGVAILIVRMGANIGWQAMRELVDTGLEAEKLERIRQVILSIDGVRTLHLLRTRQTGGLALIDVHILVDGTLSVSEGHQIAEMVRLALKNRVENIADVLVHIDPEDDQYAVVNIHLPSRSALLARLKDYFAGIEEARAMAEADIALHYLGGKLHVEIMLPLDCAPTPVAARALQERFQAAARHDADIASLIVCFR
ncbi:MAG: cation diffusion facilitator family transporter [Gammaproteobacteria bacterium]|nr:cation diffusion facilitator family transporter [Gammaproteobacteria bacterium]